MPENIRKRTKEGFFALLMFALLLLFLVGLPQIKKGIIRSLSVCAYALIPSIFPFLILSDVLLQTEGGQSMLYGLSRPVSFLFRVSHYAGCACLVGLLLGAPLGTKAVIQYYNEAKIDKKEAERLLLFTNNPGPAFLIGGIGGLLGNMAYGVLLLLVQILVTLLFARCARYEKDRSSFFGEEKIQKSKCFCLASSVRTASVQMVSICGCVLFFSAVFSLISPCLPDGAPRALLAGMLELGNASAYISSWKAGAEALPFCGAAVCFSGLSIYLQARELLSESDLSGKWMLPGKFLQAAFAFFLLSLLTHTGILDNLHFI